MAADGGVEFVGDTAGDGAGGDAAGLGVADHTVDAAAELEADLGELGGFARAGGTADDDDLVMGDGVGEFVGTVGDGEVVRIDDARGSGFALLDAGEGLEQRVGDAVEDGGDVGRSAIEGEVAGDTEVPAQVGAVREHGTVELAVQIADGGEDVGVWIRLLQSFFRRPALYGK